MRGFGETANANTLIMVDGRRLNNMDIGVPDLNSISLKDVKRVEIIQGSAGTLFGVQVVGGVINIITDTPGDFSAFAEAGYGSYESYNARAGVSHRLDNGFSYRFTLDKKETDNYRDNNALNYENVAGRLGYEHTSGEVFFDFQHVDEDLDTPAALFAAEVAADRRQVTVDFTETGKWEGVAVHGGCLGDQGLSSSRAAWRCSGVTDWALSSAAAVSA